MKEENHQRQKSPRSKQEAGTTREFFRKFAHKTSEVVGSPAAFMAAVGVLILWAFSGLFFHFSDTWQLIINTGTTIITFLIVFLIQNTQNRDAKAIHLKLDELIKNMKGARNQMVDLEDMSDEEMEQFQKEFQRLRKRKQGKMRGG